MPLEVTRIQSVDREVQLVEETAVPSRVGAGGGGRRVAR